jgi:threonine dehydratase
MDLITEILQAERRVRPHVLETGLEPSPALAERTGCNVFLKLENLQRTGSFKFRGAMNKVLSLTDAERERGIVTASSGNHGAAVALGLGTIGARGTVFVPEAASPTKVDAIRRFGAEVRHFGNDGVETEMHAREHARANGLTFISPYNDLQVVAGQGTIGVELARQIEPIDAVFVAVGGGGLISGVGGFLKSIAPTTRIIGCSPENSAVMAESVRAGRILDLESKPTLSDGTAGGIEPEAITFDLCRTLVDDFVEVSEDEIRDAMRGFMETHHMMIEGAAGVALATLMKTADQFQGGNVVVVLCGANIGLEVLKSVL